MATNKSVVDNGNNENFKDRDKTLQKPTTNTGKEFKIQNSLLTDLMDNRHMKTVYCIFVASFVGLLTDLLVRDIVDGKGIRSGFRLVYHNFGKLHLVLLSLSGLNLLTVAGYFCFVFWAQIRINLFPQSLLKKFWDYLCLLAFIGYCVSFFYFGRLLIIGFDLYLASAAIVALEQVRLSMKFYAFVRCSAPKLLKYKPHSDETLKISPFSKYLYYLYAPTFIYRDEYPRTKTIRWKFVAYRLLEVVAIILYFSFLAEKIIPTYEDFGLRKFTSSEIIISFFDTVGLGFLGYMPTFYLILHSVQNLGAELLRFGDRVFYLDWWNSTSIPEFLRKFNLLVNDFMYINIYKDAYEITGSRTLTKIILYIISWFVHDWVFFYAVGYFTPVFFFVYLSYIILSLVPTVQSLVVTVFIFYSLAFMFSSIAIWYFLEHYARVNVPDVNDTLKNPFVSWWLLCNGIE